MTDSNGVPVYMPVGPANYGGGGMLGDSSAWWIIILLIFGGWGNNGWGNNGGTNSEIQRGFDQATLTNGITNIQTALTNGFAGVSNGFAQAEISANARQMTDMNQNFAIQTGLGDIKYAIATEACANRNALASALRDILENNNAGIQRIVDQMCNDKIDAKNEQIAMLRQELTMANLAASQNAQTATLQAGQRALANEIEQYVVPTPRPAYLVQNPACTCAQNTCSGV